MNQPENTPFSRLITQFRLEAAAQFPLVRQVAEGLHPTLTPSKLTLAISQALQLEIAAADKAVNSVGLNLFSQQHHLLNAKILSGYIYDLNHPDIFRVERPDDFPESGIQVPLKLPLTVVSTRLDVEDIEKFGQVLSSMDSRDRIHFGADSDLFATFYRGWTLFGVYMAVDSHRRPLSIMTLYQHQQFGHVGNIALGQAPSCDDIGLREAMLEILIEYAPKVFRTIQAEIPSSHHAAVAAFETMSFESQVIDADIPDGPGGCADRIRFYRQLRTKEEYASQAD